MSIKKELFGPQNVEEEEIFAVEDLIFEVQMTLQKAMKREKVSQKTLAERLKVSPARVSQFFSDGGANLTLGTIARIAHALKIELLVSEAADSALAAMHQEVESDSAQSCGSLRLFEQLAFDTKDEVWTETTSNHNSITRSLEAA